MQSEAVTCSLNGICTCSQSGPSGSLPGTYLGIYPGTRFDVPVEGVGIYHVQERACCGELW